MRFLAFALALFVFRVASADVESRITNFSKDIQTSGIVATIQNMNALASCDGSMIADDSVKIIVKPKSPYVDVFSTGRPDGLREIILSEVSFDLAKYPSSPFVLLSHEYAHALFDLNMSSQLPQWKVVENPTEDLYRHAYSELFSDIAALIYSKDPDGIYNALKELDLDIIDPSGEIDEIPLRRTSFEDRRAGRKWTSDDFELWKGDLSTALSKSTPDLPYLILEPNLTAFWSNYKGRIQDLKSCLLPKLFKAFRENIRENLSNLDDARFDTIRKINGSLAISLK